jgi:hypothetical protein
VLFASTPLAYLATALESSAALAPSILLTILSFCFEKMMVVSRASPYLIINQIFGCQTLTITKVGTDSISNFSDASGKFSASI